jgi:hypothetical protein
MNSNDILNAVRMPHGQTSEVINAALHQSWEVFQGLDLGLSSSDIV